MTGGGSRYPGAAAGFANILAGQAVAANGASCASCRSVGHCRDRLTVFSADAGAGRMLSRGP